MAYDTEELKENSLHEIKKHNLVFIEDVCVYIGITKATFYAHKLAKDEDILEALRANKVKTKHSMRAKWYNSENATLQLAFYKLIGTEEECHRLNGSKTEQKITGGDGSPVQINVNFKKKNETT